MSSFIPFCLRTKCWLSLRAFSGVAVSVRGLLQDSFDFHDFPIWKPGVSEWASAAPELKEEFLRDICWEHPSSILRSRDVDPECRALLYSVVVCWSWHGPLTCPWHALDMPRAAWSCLELPGGEKMKVPWSDVLLDRYVAADSQHWSCLQLCRCRTSLGGENEQCTVCACTQLPYKNYNEKWLAGAVACLTCGRTWLPLGWRSGAQYNYLI